MVKVYKGLDEALFALMSGEVNELTWPWRKETDPTDHVPMSYWHVRKVGEDRYEYICGPREFLGIVDVEKKAKGFFSLGTKRTQWGMCKVEVDLDNCGPFGGFKR